VNISPPPSSNSEAQILPPSSQIRKTGNRSSEKHGILRYWSVTADQRRRESAVRFYLTVRKTCEAGVGDSGAIMSAARPARFLPRSAQTIRSPWRII
jgi:hypothetical protein